MTVTVDIAAEHIARRIASTIDPVFAMIDGWRDVLEHELGGPYAGALTGASEPTAATLDAVVGALVAAELEREGTIITGAGFVAAPGFLADAPWHLAWWLSGSNTFAAGPDPKLRRLEVVSDPEEVRRLRRIWAPRPWADGDRDLLLRVPWTEVSGRCVGGNLRTPVQRVVTAS